MERICFLLEINEQNISVRLRFLVFYLFLFFLLVSCQSNSYTRDEAVRSLKVLNSDFVNFFSKTGEMEELAALKFIWNHDALPLPFPPEKFAAEKPWKPYNYEESKGVYTWDSIQQVFVRSEKSNIVRILFSTGNLPDGEFLLTDYMDTTLSSRPDFPLKMNAVLNLKGEERINIRHSAEVADDLPLRIDTEVETTDSKLVFSLNRTRKNNDGNLRINFSLENKGHRFIDAGADALIGYSSMGYYFNDIQFKMNMFNHLIKGRILYSKIDPTAREYAESFNANTDIKIYEVPGNHLVGNLVLGKTHEGELLDYFIRFTDGSKVPVSEYLPFLDKLLNMKL
jgi:hypothetical protein